MEIVPCSLSHTLHLVIEAVRFQKAADEYPDAIPPGRADIEADLAKLSALGVPTFLDTDRKGEPRIIFCTHHYEIVCGLTHRGDGYYAYRVSPLSLRSHDQIARHIVAVKARAWRLHWDVSELNRPQQGIGLKPQSGFNKLQAAWEQVRQAVRHPHARPTGLSLAHQAFLSDVEALIDLAYQVELDEAACQESTPVGGIEPVAQARLAGDVYRFTLATPTDLGVGDYVWAGIGEPGERGPGYTGVITEATQQALIVCFHQQVDLARLRRVEWLMPWVSTKQYDIQKAAVHALREERSRNPHVLRLIVDGHFEPFQSPVVREGKGVLNLAQRTMIARAERVPDMLLVLGPPGTGKTHTIRAIAAQQAAHKKRVLITSKNNKAVDNVLEELEGVDALRIGREEAVSAEVRKLMIDEKARRLQAQILDKIIPTLETLDAIQALWPQVQHILSDLTQRAADWRLAQARHARQLQALADWQRARYADVAQVIERQTRRFQAAHQGATRAARRANGLSRRMDLLSPLCQLPLVGAIFVVWSTRLDEQWQHTAQMYRQAIRELGRTADQIREIWDTYRQSVSASDEVLRYKHDVADAEKALAQLRSDTAQVAARLAAMLARFEDVPSLGSVDESPEALETAGWRLHDWHKALVVRWALLHDWHDLLQMRRQALYPTLIQMADVVGATCIGVATDARFEDLEFDLMIADEAGQIQVMDLLVPLVRAKRAVLVGDHRQLPPMVKNEVAERIDPEEDAQRAWLEQSLFEQLFDRETTPKTHTVMLDMQYRMPRAIADFISHHFYDGRFRTGRDVFHTDPFFDVPMVFVDTMEEHNRQERCVIEPEGIRGYTNDLEAGLIADLVLTYHAYGAQWGVIVPYKRQAELIHQKLRRRRQALPGDILKDWVATLDSFQGKERDVIIYGFTRSNPHGRVGFLAELRRLNVCLTRARHQLVLIGDSTTLAQAVDGPFANLMQDLLNTVKASPGGYLHVRDLRQRLRH